MTGGKQRKTAIARLRQLPAIFSVRDLVILDGAMQLERASVYCLRWKRAGLIKPFGPRLGLFRNLVVDPTGSESIDTALIKIFGGPIVAGVSALHEAGIITQIPQQLHVAVLASRTLPSFFDVVLMPRPAAWWIKTKPYLTKPVLDYMRSLEPEAALADMIAAKDLQSLDPDDFDLDRLDIDQLADIIEELGAEPPAWLRDPGLRL